jgi:hypothetical protein
MANSEAPGSHGKADQQLMDGMRALLARYGDPSTVASANVTTAVEQLRTAIPSSAEDGNSLSALEITRIRLGKFAAARLPPELFRDPLQLAALRADILQLARVWLRQETETL